MHNFHAVFERIYEKPGEEPWTFKNPPKEIVELVENKIIKPCTVLDVGCGEGYYSIYLSSKGFNVTGIDFSKNAIDLAKKNANYAQVNCQFLSINYKNISKLNKKFDFVLEWRFLHEIIDLKERKRYIEDIFSLLKPRGYYLSVSFSCKSKVWGEGKLRTPKQNVTIYLSSKEELEELFKKNFEILKYKIIELPEKGEDNIISNYFFMRKSIEQGSIASYERDSGD